MSQDFDNLVADLAALKTRFETKMAEIEEGHTLIGKLLEGVHERLGALELRNLTSTYAVTTDTNQTPPP